MDESDESDDVGTEGFYSIQASTNPFDHSISLRDGSNYTNDGRRRTGDSSNPREHRRRLLETVTHRAPTTLLSNDPVFMQMSTLQNFSQRDSLETDAASLSQSIVPQPRAVACTDSDIECSPKGSPGSKLEEFVPNTPYNPRRPVFKDRLYGQEDLDTSTFHGRLAYFHVYGWNHEFMNKRILAEAGFYYLGEDDEVICSGCDGSLRQWDRGDDPWEEHEKIFKDTCFIKAQQ